MSAVTDYVSRIEGTCGADQDVIVNFRFEKKDEVITRIKQRAQLKNTVAGIIFEMYFEGVSFRLYPSGKAIFRGFRTKIDLMDFLAKLLL